MSKPVLIPFKNFHSMIHSGFRTFTGTKTINMRNRSSSGLSHCFSCRSFVCCCLASLSRNHHIFDVLTGRRKCDQSAQKTLNFYRLCLGKVTKFQGNDVFRFGALSHLLGWRWKTKCCLKKLQKSFDSFLNFNFTQRLEMCRNYLQSN